MAGEAKLFEGFGALHAGCRLAYLLHGGNQQPDQNGDDGNHHQQFDERKTNSFSWHDSDPRKKGKNEDATTTRLYGGILTKLLHRSTEKKQKSAPAPGVGGSLSFTPE